MKDLTPVDENDVLLARRERLSGRGRKTPDDHLNLMSEKRAAERREKFVKSAPVALDILQEARAALAVRFRFLDQALWRMPLIPREDLYGIASDGVNLYYDPVYVCDRFMLSSSEVVRDVAHCLFHCIFRHPFMLYSVLREPWDVACDIAIESILIDLLGEAFPSNMDRRAKQSLRVLRAQVGGTVTAERLYHLFSNEGNHIDLRSLHPLFDHDVHGLWYNDEETDGSRAQQGAARQQSEDKEGGSLPETKGSESLDDKNQASGGESDQGASDQGESDEENSSDETSEGSGNGDESDRPSEEERNRARDDWAETSRRIQTELETAVAQQGDEAGNLVSALRAVNREKYDYETFLKRFAVLRERMLVNPDEFDYIYYTYGLDRYGNMPLIEPLEYREDKSIHDFVIAVDTSESCSGELVQAFIVKTYNILKQIESYHERVNIHIVQCDARIQDDTKIESLDQLDAYLSTMELHGFGGTDFRPVFDYVNLLIEKRELVDLKGLVYFTDGQGTFPQKRPDYDVVFAFLDDGYSDPQVPPWALKIILDERQLRIGEAC